MNTLPSPTGGVNPYAFTTQLMQSQGAHPLATQLTNNSINSRAAAAKGQSDFLTQLAQSAPSFSAPTLQADVIRAAMAARGMRGVIDNATVSRYAHANDYKTYSEGNENNANAIATGIKVGNKPNIDPSTGATTSYGLPSLQEAQLTQLLGGAGNGNTNISVGGGTERTTTSTSMDMTGRIPVENVITTKSKTPNQMHQTPTASLVDILGGGRPAQPTPTPAPIDLVDRNGISQNGNNNPAPVNVGTTSSSVVSNAPLMGQSLQGNVVSAIGTATGLQLSEATRSTDPTTGHDIVMMRSADGRVYEGVIPAGADISQMQIKQVQ